MNTILSTVLNSRHQLLKGLYGSIDTEFKINLENQSKPYTIYAASIVASDGKIENRHIIDFQDQSQPEKELVKWLTREILKYELTIGWYSKGVRLVNEDGSVEGKDSDLKVLDSVCKYYNIPSIIAFDRGGIPYIRGYDYNLIKISPEHARESKFRWYYHIDLYKIYKKPMVKSVIFGNRYKSLGLDAVCKAIIGEGKYQDLDGSRIQKLSREEQLEYVAQDANLVMKLSKHNNYEILDLMNAISRITNIRFERVCHTQLSTWWKTIIENKIIEGDCRTSDTKVNKRRYAGGYVIAPKIGFYEKSPVYVVDVKSLYPSMIIGHNISFDTVNCDCCKDDSAAKVDDEIMNIINSNVAHGEKREHYWICKAFDYRGIVPRLLQQFRDERFKHQELGNELMQLALKNLINGCYGIFGSTFFEYSDYRVAELTTAFGRHALQHMQHIAKEVYDFNVIYGDTDSIFITGVRKDNDIMKFIAECSILLDIDVEISDGYKKFLITKKKHYIGIPLDECQDPIIKGMEGIKSDRPLWINRTERQFAEDIKYGKDPTVNIRKEYEALETGRVPLEELEIKLTLAKSPDEYPTSRLQRVIGSKLGASQGDIIKYYKSDVKGGGTSNPNLISKTKYIEMLRITVEDILKLMGYDYNREIVSQHKLISSNN